MLVIMKLQLKIFHQLKMYKKNMKEYAESMEEPPAEYKDEIVKTSKRL